MKSFGLVGPVGFEITLSVLVGFYGGSFLDERLGTTPWLKWFGLVAGVGAAIKSLIRVLKKVRKDLEGNDTPTRAQAHPSDSDDSRNELSK